ncbi:hypothetical protein [Sulfurimonas microaerophilic]|uniref:hypothetical protein n=1 Tax=Sulfurimonas microaerophilic TaxID=3058392 RepID=UPI0027149CEB|nr:hypothetical protein [Sulfurimonas sp. hsl 1-7]
MKFLLLIFVFITTVTFSSVDFSEVTTEHTVVSVQECEKSQEFETSDDRDDIKCTKENYKISFENQQCLNHPQLDLYQDFLDTPHLRPPIV